MIVYFGGTKRVIQEAAYSSKLLETLFILLDMIATMLESNVKLIHYWTKEKTTVVPNVGVFIGKISEDNPNQIIVGKGVYSEIHWLTREDVPIYFLALYEGKSALYRVGGYKEIICLEANWNEYAKVSVTLERTSFDRTIEHWISSFTSKRLYRSIEEIRNTLNLDAKKCTHFDSIKLPRYGNSLSIHLNVFLSGFYRAQNYNRAEDAAQQVVFSSDSQVRFQNPEKATPQYAEDMLIIQRESSKTKSLLPVEDIQKRIEAIEYADRKRYEEAFRKAHEAFTATTGIQLTKKGKEELEKRYNFERESILLLRRK